METGTGTGVKPCPQNTKVNNRKQIFAVDIDGVVCKTSEAIYNQVKRDYGIEGDYKTQADYNHNFGKITFSEAVEKYFRDENFILSLKVFPGSKKFISFLKDRFFVFFFTTRRHSFGATKEWIARKFGDTPVSFVQRKADKPFDFLIDDNPTEIMVASVMGRKGFLLERPYNKHFFVRYMLVNLTHNSYIVKDFKEVCSALEKKDFWMSI